MAQYDPDWRDHDHPGIATGKLRVDVKIALLEASNISTHASLVFQAQRCPRCKMLLAVGNSFRDHVLWCKE
jgi:hypothetical protein